ncbi:MAG TPA: LacI family DNA-binding transcriptional regulator [Candidatus Sulfotelmatobacter sp.]|nr:LacI family DNA-binding transcriptional regulator [Candidatus Sulfotelmatobacter sp.]
MSGNKTGRTTGRAVRMGSKPVSLKELAERLGLSPATISLVINGSHVADSIPKETKDRIFAAVRKYKYRPNFFARSLRAQRSFTIGVIVPEVSDGYSASVMSGVEEHLLQEGYFYFVVSHRHRADLIDEYPRLFLERSVDGLIAVDTPWTLSLSVPVVTVSGHNQVKGVTNIVLDHVRAAEVALKHLSQLGHRDVAFIKGQEFSSDTEVRWSNIQKAARQFGIPIVPALVSQLEGDSPSPELGYQATRRLLASRKPFTALFAFNDISAMGAIRALREAKLRVPQDVSVIGFDDIQSAAYQNPALTTVRQPLREMGRIAAETLLRRIRRPGTDSHGGETMVEPKLIVRETTCQCPANSSAKKI